MAGRGRVFKSTDPQDITIGKFTYPNKVVCRLWKCKHNKILYRHIGSCMVSMYKIKPNSKKCKQRIIELGLVKKQKMLWTGKVKVEV